MLYMPLSYICENTKWWNTKCCDSSSIYLYWHGCQTQIVFAFQLISSVEEKSDVCFMYRYLKMKAFMWIHGAFMNFKETNHFLYFPCMFINSALFTRLSANAIWNVFVISLFHGSIEGKCFFLFQVICHIHTNLDCFYLIKVKYKRLDCLVVDRWHVVLYYESELTQSRW